MNMRKSNVISLDGWISSNNTTTNLDSCTASGYGKRKPHPCLAQLLEEIYEFRNDAIENDELADSTMLYAIQALMKIPSELPTPSLDIDQDGFIEIEWEKNGSSFSMYITDTRRTAFAAYYGPDDCFSGYQDIDDIFGDVDLSHIWKVLTDTSKQWNHLAK